ncbi:hypothetical protein A2625_03295 [candidate division WOR-1 bacterium RIFCSPHIGHO2_01_FULL_53_15]|uniref:Uncharacterized protein n=1 Tax=candidate division WOR-1 bacterium RIFCSPHIGHO2_01_FULL_53_15 TaxID=1802564 RepID=A0A1F4Q3Q8_UNCSA|nr:MAG: hypothetical protein A2625_03295 [candidate division WOR-1 bacterium RIFCSPHIGHO2_01_FULL_53_15]OGC12487.1 MAG: hypothetical protein A3D23_05715 [candidate division WOR-1 bacterium RIFCSPHIGHO2_02_FULL_53_26]
MKVERHYEDFQKPKKIEQGGRLKLSGAFLLDHEEELVNLIKHEGRLAEQKNPLHKVSKIEKVNGGIEAEVTDHNLAMHIGKALSHAYKGEHKYKFREGEKYVEVDWRRD